MPLLHNPNVFANNPLDRMSHKRTDATWVTEKLKAKDSFVLPMYKEHIFVLARPDGVPEVGFMRPDMFASAYADGATVLFLGLDKKDRAYFAVDLPDAGDPSKSGVLKGLGEFGDLRALASTLNGEDAAIAAQAKAILKWHSTHKFCSTCGAPTVIAEAGYRRDCATCKTQHFPRTDPVVIMLATYGDKALLGRQKTFPKGMYSALAGFVEPGESIEEAVARELFEEAECRISSVTYRFTQPWPWPMSLMIGCSAVAETDHIKADGIEVEEANWYSRDYLRKAMEGEGDGKFFVPPPFAIAHQLVKQFVYET